jgi:hypothetical protein
MTRKIKYLIPAVLLLAVACKKQLDINTDPNNPSKASVTLLLTGAEKNLGNVLASGLTNDYSGLSQILITYTHQMTTRENPDQYGATGGDFTLQTAWTSMYASLNGAVANSLEVIINDGTKDGNLKYVGIAKILKAYAYSQFVDVFGDVPFSEASKQTSGIFNPKFDKGSDIYPQLFTLLDQGIADLRNTTAANLLTPGANDVIYQGNVEKWIRAANTIKLKLLVQQRLVKNVAADVTALIAKDSLIKATDQSFLLPYGPNGATDDRNPGYSDYYATQRGSNVSPWFYEILKGYNPNIYTGVVDPRIPYYFFNQLTANQGTEGGQTTEYRDGGFVSIYFGSVGPDRDKTQQNNSTLFGIYPVGGRYDDKAGKAGAGGKITGTSATGAAPYRFITYADRLYLEAELIKTNVIAGDAKAKLKAAIEESFAQIDYVVGMTKTTQQVPSLKTGSTFVPAVVTYVDAVLAQYDAKPAQQLESIMTQKWISSFGSAVDQYTDYRRTGFPILFNPKDPSMAPGGLVQPPIFGDPAQPAGQKKVPVLLNRNFPMTLPWYTTELETNSNAPAQKSDPSTYKPFWKP